MDKIFLRGMRFVATHGVLPHERVVPQPFVLDLDLGLDLGTAGKEDDLAATVSYAEVYDVAANVMQGETKNLIEALAEGVAEELLAAFQKLRWVRVMVHKPAAPICGLFSDVGVSITRCRGSS